VVPRSLAFAPDRGGSFFIFCLKPVAFKKKGVQVTLNSLKGGGSVESDLGDLDLVEKQLKNIDGGLIQAAPVSD
jgi:hypothetical protein